MQKQEASKEKLFFVYLLKLSTYCSGRLSRKGVLKLF